MATAVLKNKKGFTLIEALVALFLLAFLLLGLLSALVITYEQTTKNLIRDEAVKIADEYAEKYRNIGINNIPASKTEEEKRKIRNAEVTYTVEINSQPVPGTNNQVKKVEITVKWNYKGKEYSHKIETLVRAL